MKTVCLLTAGTGSRMGPYAPIINKSLLPVNEKAIISTIIQQFDEDTRFVVVLGYKKEQVQTYLRVAHPTTSFEFAEVDKFEGSDTGPARSLKAAQHLLQDEFMLVVCDGLYEDLASFPTDSNYIGVSKVSFEDSPAYSNIIEKNGEVVEIVDKRPCAAGLASNGTYYIKDTESFWKNLGTVELSSGYSALNLKTYHGSWVDLGTIERYRSHVAKCKRYDFSKVDEFLYIVNGRVIKLFAKEELALQRYRRSVISDGQFPSCTYEHHGFYWHEFVEGDVLYKNLQLSTIQGLINHLRKNLWCVLPNTRLLSVNDLHRFYHEKTMDRVLAFHRKYPGFAPKVINQTEITTDLGQLLDKINWEMICGSNLMERTAFIHGDCQPDNIIFKDGRLSFIDWRQDFAGHLDIGDTYYDYAKLLAGLQVNFDLVKEGMFLYKEKGTQVEVFMPCRDVCYNLVDYLKQTIDDFDLVQDIAILIFLNMAPLHEAPFDKALYCFALEKLMNK